MSTNNKSLSIFITREFQFLLSFPPHTMSHTTKCLQQRCNILRWGPREQCYQPLCYGKDILYNFYLIHRKGKDIPFVMGRGVEINCVSTFLYNIQHTKMFSPYDPSMMKEAVHVLFQFNASESSEARHIRKELGSV